MVELLLAVAVATALLSGIDVLAGVIAALGSELVPTHDCISYTTLGTAVSAQWHIMHCQVNLLHSLSRLALGCVHCYSSHNSPTAAQPSQGRAGG